MLSNEKFVFETEVLDNIHRDGVSEFLEWLNKKTDFFGCPASTRFHGSCESGLVKHSLAVFRNFWKIAPEFGFDWDNFSQRESSAICCLFHDVCKANTYQISFRNTKNEETGAWERTPYYTINEQLPYGSHGAKSVFLVQRYIKLTEEEAMAIHNHMGAYNNGTYEKPGMAYDYSKLAWLVHVADEAATFIDKE